MAQSIESYGHGPVMSGGGWGEGDRHDPSPEAARHYRRLVRDLAPGEEVPVHTAAARGYAYVVEDIVLAAPRLLDGAGADADDAARAATAHLHGGNPLLAYLLAAQWVASERGGPLIDGSQAVDAADGTGFVPGTLDGDIYTYDCPSEDWDGDVERYRHEVEIDHDLCCRAREWFNRVIPAPRRRLYEVMT